MKITFNKAVYCIEKHFPESGTWKKDSDKVSKLAGAILKSIARPKRMYEMVKKSLQ
jgi:hypothetical protein